MEKAVEPTLDEAIGWVKQRNSIVAKVIIRELRWTENGGSRTLANIPPMFKTIEEWEEWNKRHNAENAKIRS